MPSLTEAFAKLNDEQKDAVLHDGSVAVLAGPGSGKTDTLAVKAGHLLTSVVDPPRGVACITFNNDAVREIGGRLGRMGFHPGRRLFLGSLHSFCLNCVIRPYGDLVDARIGRSVAVASDRQIERFLQQAAGEVAPGVFNEWYSASITKLRRAQTCDEDTTGADDRDLDVIRRYEELLRSQGLIDFEGIVAQAADLVKNKAWVRRLLASRFPWLLVDEYQDLGGPLHVIVTMLADRAKISVFAVGDPDQTVYDFSGADPKYLVSLSDREDFKTVQLRFNYRSGRHLIVAGQAALSPEDGPRHYEPDPKRMDRGRVEFRRADDDLDDHARVASAVASEWITNGTCPHEIAILYRANRNLPALQHALTEADVPFTAERELRYPKTPVLRWLQQAAGWAISPMEAREIEFTDLLWTYTSLLEEAGAATDNVSVLAARVALYNVLRQTRPKANLISFLETACTTLRLVEALDASTRRSGEDKEKLIDLIHDARVGRFKEHRVEDFADDGRVIGRVVVTTLHSAKGRQFDIVIIPGLTEGIIPPWRWNSIARRMEAPAARPLRESRRLFYVGFTRARRAVELIWSEGYKNKGFINTYGRSRFVTEIQTRLAADAKVAP